MEYSPEFNWELFPKILRIPHGSVPRIFHEHIFNLPGGHMITFEKITAGQRDGYTTCCLLDYPYFKQHYKIIVTDVSKQQALDADPKAIQHINLTGNLERGRNKIMFFITEEEKETILDFSQRTVRVLKIYFALI